MNEDRAQELRQILAASGSVTFIKSGQALSLRGDLVKNREYVRELTKLQASAAASAAGGQGLRSLRGCCVVHPAGGVVDDAGWMRRTCVWVVLTIFLTADAATRA